MILQYYYQYLPIPGICADTYTKYISKTNTACRPIFSDAASAILISKSTKNKIGPFELGADGSGADALELPTGTNEIVMNGAKVLTFAMDVVPNNVNKLLKKIKTDKKNIHKFIFHQASKLVIDKLIDILKLDENKVFTNYDKIGNTVSSSIPIALESLKKSKKIKKNQKIMLVGFGVGLSAAASIINWI